jgi:DNA-binding SARP family transcriptional activator
MEFRILGPLEIIGSRGAVRLGGSKPRSLLTMLLLYANEPVSAERLALALWGDEAASGAVRNLHVHVSRLRKALADEDVLTTTPVGYRLRVGEGELDADRFQRLAEDGRRALTAGDAPRAAALLGDALSLWRGPPLEDVAYEAFAQAEIARLQEQRLAALELRVEADLAMGRHDELVSELRSLITEFPARERLTGQLMLALYRCGRQSEALEAYARTRSYLSEELGLEPRATLKALQRDILEQSAELDLSIPTANGPQRARATAEDAQLPLPAPLVHAIGADDMFVGRAADIEVLTGVYADVARGDRRFMLVSGEPGIGKTRLAAEFARRAHDQGAIVLYGRCDEEALLAQQPFVEALRHYLRGSSAHDHVARLPRTGAELRRLVPEIADLIPTLPAPLAGDPEGARSRLFEAVGSLLCEAAQETPLVLVLDDLHWADRATLLLLKYLIRYPADARLMVLGLYRDTEVDPEHPLSAALASLGREDDLERRALAPLDEGAVSELVDVHVGEDAPAELGRIVYEGTEGNAFFVVETLRHLNESGTLEVDEAGSHPRRLAVPESVKDVIGHRVVRLGREANRLLAAASVLGSEFKLDVLERVGAVQEDELVDGIDSAVRAQVIEELAGPAGRYTFSHRLIRDTVYGALSATRRAILHRRAGEAIEHVHGGDLEPHLSELAHHFAQAGFGGDTDKAIEYGRRAGEYALEQSAYEQAAAHFRGTVELIDQWDPARRLAERCDLVIAQGEAERQAGVRAYRQTLLAAARSAIDLGDAERLARAALANNRGIYSSGHGVDRERVEVLSAALDAYDPADSPVRAALLALLALELTTDRDPRLRELLNDQAVAMARRVGDPRTLAQVLTQRCISQWNRSQMPGERRANLREAAELADQLNDPLLIGHAAYLGAQAAMNVGELDECDRVMRRLSEVAEKLAQPFMRWHDSIVRAKRCVISGPPDEAERRAFKAFELGKKAGQPDCELWFLGQIIAACFLQGALDRVLALLPDAVRTPGSSLEAGPDVIQIPQMRLLSAAAMSMILAEVGRLDEARRFLDLLMRNDLDRLPPDYTALLIPVYASVAAARLGDVRSAERLHALLEPRSERLVTTVASWFGAVNHHLGVLATTLCRADEAEARFAEAERTYESLEAEPWLVRLRQDRAATLVAVAQPANGRPAPY